VLVDLSSGTGLPDPSGVDEDRLASLPFVVVGTHAPAEGGDDRGDGGGDGGDGVSHGWRDLCDVVVREGDGALERIEENLAAHPITGATLALLLRGQSRLPVGHGLVAESAAYSVLQAGPEFAAWRHTHPVRAVPDARNARPRVRVAPDGATLRITLTRGHKLNALDARMRDELVEALELAAGDQSIMRVELRGEGRAFCAGGDLDEFGSRPDPATAHLIRLERSVARALAGLTKESVAYVHGATVGSGAELAAFTARVVAAPDTLFALPEIELGLVPGAGGTVSLPRRIGRLRTAWLAFSGLAIDASTAVAWGLADEIAEG
jgi:Enoyl-CoA hydratase/isomerase